MKILFAVSDGSISESITKKYQKVYKEIIISKNVYYFNAIVKELQKDKNYDRIIISEDLEPFTSNNYETIDNFIFEKMDNISDEATTYSGDDIPIILIATDRRTRTDNLLNRLFGIGIYSTLIGQDRNIDEICKLIDKPRSKKEAKKYYRIDSSEVEYKPENEGNVSETEIQNILAYFKRLGKNEERYVESFNSVAMQYTDQQLKVIIKFLPSNVKDVLEANSHKYQELVSFGDQNPANKVQLKAKRGRKSKSKNENGGITVSSIPSDGNKLTKPVVIPSANKTKKIKEETETIGRTIVRPQVKTEKHVIEPKIKELRNEEDKELNLEETKKRRGRPRKLQQEVQEKVEDIMEEEPKKKKGRPKKEENLEKKEIQNNNEIDDLLEFNDFEEENNILPGFEQNESDSLQSIDIEDENVFEDFNDFENDEKSNENEDYESIGEEYEDKEHEDDEYDEQFTSLPGLEDDELEENDEDEYKDELYDEKNNENQNLDKLEEDDNDSFLPGFDSEGYDEDSTTLTGFEEEQQSQQEQKNPSESHKHEYRVNAYEQFEDKKDLQNTEIKPSTIEKLLTNNQKIVAFVGTTKNGTSFLVNNIAEVLSNQGIKTAILDLTKNKNSYYIYTKNEEELRKTAFSCIEKLKQGIAQGIKVNKNLDVYTTLPNNDQHEKYQEILETLVKNYSLILLDCDFKTNYEYLNEAQEIYLVQSMDVLTIQPLTAYLRDLKAKGVLDQTKLKAIINKHTRVRGITEKAIIGGMAFYNDPAMTYMTELFNRETIPYCSIPFDSQVYSKYLEALINCNISVNDYSKDFINSLKKLANMVYPLIGTGITNKKEKFNNPKYNQYSTNTFSNDVNSTLDKMRGNY